MGHFSLFKYCGSISNFRLQAQLYTDIQSKVSHE